MDLLQFARGPALQWSLIIFAVGVLWRVFGLVLLRHKKDLNEPRNAGLLPWLGGLKVIFQRMWPRKGFANRTAYSETMGYIFHIGLAIVVFGFTPHILFIKDVFGVGWSGMPNTWIYAVGVVTMVAMIALLIRRLTHPVLRLLSNFDDYFSWLVTILPVVTGLIAAGHIGARYETLIALHILSFELLLIWLPFGKLMHAFLFALSRGATGYVFTRRGAST